MMAISIMIYLYKNLIWKSTEQGNDLWNDQQAGGAKLPAKVGASCPTDHP